MFPREPRLRKGANARAEFSHDSGRAQDHAAHGRAGFHDNRGRGNLSVTKPDRLSSWPLCLTADGGDLKFRHAKDTHILTEFSNGTSSAVR